MGIAHGKLRVEQAIGSGLYLPAQLGAGKLHDGRVGLNGSAFLDAHSSHRAAGGGCDGLLVLIIEPGRSQRADTVDGGGCGLCGGQAAIILHGNGHGAHQQIAAADGIGAGHGLHRAGKGLKGTVEYDLRSLTHGKPRSIRCREFQREQQAGIVPHGGDLLPGGHVVTGLDFDGSHCAANDAADVLGIGCIVVAALCLLQRKLGLFHTGGNV